jgi:nucleoside-diphosphate-sugar epimerase
MTDATQPGTVLIAGASGVIGAAAIERFASLGWRVIGVSRRRPDVDPGAVHEHLALDLRDAAACRAASSAFAGVTHVVYTALFEKPGLVPGWLEADQMTTNLAMMRNLMDPLREAAAGLRHVSVLQGTKAYGVHVHPVAIPCRENRPRDAHDNFYWLQEDYIRAAQKGADWTFTIWRPQIVFGGPTGVAMNLIPIIGAYAAICREEGLPFQCPATTPNVLEAVDADLIARAFAWAAQAPAAQGETFNITNGDVFVWRNVWPAIAEAVGLQPAFAEAPIALSTFLPEHADTWDAVVARHGLRPTSMADLVGESHHYADFIFGFGGPSAVAVLVSTTKLRQAGFGDCVDTEVMFRTWLKRLADRKVIPEPGA